MNRRISICTFLAIFLRLSLIGQDPDIFFSGEFDEVSFLDFVQEVQNQTGTSFYFLADWIVGITVTAMGENISIQRTLDEILRPAGLSYIIIDENQVYLGQHTSYLSSLPSYTGYQSEPDDFSVFDNSVGLTNTEQNYIEGRKSRILDTLVVGSADEGIGLDNAVIHGKITDEETGEPLIGATIYFEDLKKGAAADLDGRFSIVVKPGGYTAEFKSMGLEDKRFHLKILSNGVLDINLRKTVITITEVVVDANRYKNVRGTQMGYERLNAKVMKDVPVVMGERDVLRVVQMLPGVQSVGEGATGFNVRGSAHDQNLIYINKVPVYNSSHLFGFFTSFNPDIIKDFSLYKSNLPASYGGRMASIFDITTHQGNMNKFALRGGISPVTGHLTTEFPIKKNKSSLLLAARSTYSDWILKQTDLPVLEDSEAQFHDLAGAFTWEPGEKTLIKVFGYLSQDHFVLGTTNDYAYSNLGGSLNIRQRFGDRTSMNLAVVYGEYEYSTTNRQKVSKAYSQDYRISHYEVRADLSWLSLGMHKLTYGVNGIYYDLDRGVIEPFGDSSNWIPVTLGEEYGVEAAAYLADEIAIFPWMTLYAGLRFVDYKTLGPDEVMVYGENLPKESWNVVDTLHFGKNEVSSSYNSIEPRVALNLMVGPNNSFKFSYNRVRQFMFMLTNTTAISPVDQWKLCDYHIEPPYVEQFSAGYYLNVPKGSLSTSLEFYYKTISDLVDYKGGASFNSTPHVETLTVTGDQEAYGIEAMIRKGTGKLTGWISYSYARSLMQFVSPFPEESINYGNPFPSNYDRPHSFNLVSTLKLNRRLSVSSSLVYMTGRPVTYPISLFFLEGMSYLKYSERNNYRLPDYFRLDLSLTLEGNLKAKKRFHSYWMLNFYNVTGRQNAYSVYFQTNKSIISGYKLSIFGQMIATLSWNFKLGNYASE